MTGLNHNIKRQHGFENLRTEGQVPEDLRGSLYRVGPGLVEKFGQNVHPFMADGLITAINIDATPQGACQLVKSEKFVEEERAGKDIYSVNAPVLRKIYNGLTGKVKNTGNTNVMAWQDKLYALMEQGQPVEFDGENLSTVGSRDLGVIRGSFSAHPHRVETLKTTFNFGVDKQHVVIYALPDKGPIRVVSKFKAPWASIIHDFCVTDKHAIFFIDPGKLVLWRAIMGGKDFSKYFYWDAEACSNIIVVPFDAPQNLVRIEVDPFRVWHFANAYEQGGEIIVDAFRHDNIDILDSPTDVPDVADPELYRYRIDLTRRVMRQEQLAKGASEFPIVSPHFIGAKHRFIWMQTYKDKIGNEGFGRFDVVTGKTMRYEVPDGHLTSEAMFVPSGEREEQGWILQLTKDKAVDQSYLGIYNAERIGDEPVARLWFDQSIPATFHGCFVPEV